MTRDFKKKVREGILKRRRKTQGRYGILEERPRPTRDGRKTYAMLLIESEFGQPIEELISEGKLADIADRLGLKSFATISYWRKRLGMRE